MSQDIDSVIIIVYYCTIVRNYCTSLFISVCCCYSLLKCITDSTREISLYDKYGLYITL